MVPVGRRLGPTQQIGRLVTVGKKLEFITQFFNQKCKRLYCLIK